MISVSKLGYGVRFQMKQSRFEHCPGYWVVFYVFVTLPLGYPNFLSSNTSNHSDSGRVTKRKEINCNEYRMPAQD